MRRAPNSLRFSAVIYKIGINPVVDPPEEILNAIFRQAGKTKGPVPVRGRINGAEFSQTLVKYQGAWRLYVNGLMLESSGLKLGDTADIEIEYDPRPREFPVPPALANAFTKDKTAKRAFEALAPSRQKEIVRYLASLKTAESLERNIQRVLGHLRGHSKTSATGFLRSVNNRKK